MSDTVEVDNLSIDDIRKLAVQEEETDQPTQQDEPEVTVYRKEIDLGDGSGVQVFTSDSLEGLVEKLAEAQTNATRKIREQANRLKALEVKPAEKVPTEDEEYVLGQKLIVSPTQTLREQIDAELERREKAQKEKAEREAAVAQDFVTRNPDYLANPYNGAKLFDYLQTYKLDPTVDNLERAYTELNGRGLLQVRSVVQGEEEGVTKDAETVSETARIGQTEVRPKVVEPIQRKKAASGLSGRGASTTPPARNAGPSEEELYNMPLDKLRELAEKSAHAA